MNHHCPNFSKLTKNASYGTNNAFPVRLLLLCLDLFSKSRYSVFCSMILIKISPFFWKTNSFQCTSSSQRKSLNDIFNCRPISFVWITFSFHLKLHPKQFGFQSTSIIQLDNFMKFFSEIKQKQRLSTPSALLTQKKLW